MRRRAVRRILIIPIILFTLMLTAIPVWGQSVMQGDQCWLSAETVIEGDLLVLCRALVIDGIVRGDILGGATTATINGTIEGSIYLLAGRLDIGGTVGRDVHFVGSSLHVASSTQLTDPRASLYSVGLSTTIADMHIPGSLSALGYQLTLAGEVQNDARFAGAALDVRGHVGGDIEAAVGGDENPLFRILLPLLINTEPLNPGLSVRPTAQIDGILRYSAPNEAEINATLTNPPIFTRIVTQPEIVIVDESDPSRLLLEYLSQAIRELVILLGIGALTLIIAPRAAADWANHQRAHPVRALGVGAVSVIAALPAWILIALAGVAFGAALTMIGLAVFGISAATLIVALAIGGASGFYFAAVFIARVIVCIALGAFLIQWIASRTARPRIRPPNMRGAGFVVPNAARTANPRPLWQPLAVGAPLIALLVSLPTVGWLFNLLAVCAGVGAIFIGWYNRRRQPVMIYPPSAVHIPSDQPPSESAPPIMDDPPALGAGMDNLPQGFNWWRSDDYESD